MFQLFFSFIIPFVFTSCSSVYANRSTPHQKEAQSIQLENTLLLVAIDSQLRGNTLLSASLFQELYTKTQKQEYFTEYLKALNESNQFSKVIEESKKVAIIKDENIREVAKSYFFIGDYPEALKEYKRIKDFEENDYRFLAEIYFKLKNYQMAVKYIEKAYQINQAPELVLSMAKIEYLYLANLKRAIYLLNSHNRLYMFNDEVAEYLAKLYREDKNYEEALSIYKTLYNKSLNNQFAISIIELLSYLSKTDELIKFLKETNYNNDLLLRLYMSNKMYKEGYQLSQQLLEKDKENPYLLAQNGVFEYKLKIEEKKDIKTFLPSVIEKLEESVHKIQDASYFNYLGYLMIDHDFNIKKGLEYIQMALEIDPDSYFIIDSLAWGEYKLGKCKKAYQDMKKVVDNLGLEDKEIQKHWQAIKKCQ